MKKTLSRILCLALALLMVVTVVGCGKKPKQNTVETDESDFSTTKGGTGTTDVDTKVETKAVEQTKIVNPDTLSLSKLMAQVPANLKGTTVNVYSWNDVKEVTGAGQVISNFEKSSGIKVKWTTGGYDDYDAKIAAMINAGNSPDVIRYRGPNVHRVNLCTDIKTATGFDFSGAIWDSRVTNKYNFKNKIYGVNLKNTLVNQPYVIIYRNSIIEKNKLENPYSLWKSGNWTWNKMVELCKKYKENNPNGTPYMSYNHIDMTHLKGDDIITFDPNKGYTSNLSSQTVFNDLKQMCDLRSEGISTSAMRLEKVMEQSQTCFMLFNSICLRKTNAHFKDIKADDDLFAVPIPTIAGAKGYEFAELEAYGVPKGAKNGAAVYFFLRYYLDADNYNKNTYFCNNQALEVYNACMKQSNFLYDQSEDVLTIVTEGGGGGGLGTWIRDAGSSSQLKGQIDKVKPTFNLAVKKANEVFAKLK